MSDAPIEFQHSLLPFQGGLYRAYGLRAIDGDTIDILVDLGLSCYRTETVRVAGVNTPELHASDPVVRGQAQAAKAFTAKLIEGRVFIVRTYRPAQETEKYGRYLAEVQLPGGTLASQLIAAGLGVPFMVEAAT